MAGGHDSHAHPKPSGGGGGGKGFGEQFIERFAPTILIVGLVVGVLYSCASDISKRRPVVDTNVANTLSKVFGDDSQIKGCVPPLIAPWPCHEPKRR